MELPAFLLPGFAINWEQNQVTRQWQFHGLTHIQSNILTGFPLIVAVLQTLYALLTLLPPGLLHGMGASTSPSYGVGKLECTGIVLFCYHWNIELSVSAYGNMKHTQTLVVLVI